MIRYMHRRLPVEAMKYSKKNEAQLLEWLKSKKVDGIKSAFINGIFVHTRYREKGVTFKSQEILYSGDWIAINEDMVTVLKSDEFHYRYELEKSDAT